MVHVRFDTSSIGYDDYIQTGEGGLESASMPIYSYFKGSPHMSGAEYR
jgi:hypothetical protein